MLKPNVKDLPQIDVGTIVVGGAGNLKKGCLLVRYAGDRKRESKLILPKDDAVPANVCEVVFIGPDCSFDVEGVKAGKKFLLTDEGDNESVFADGEQVYFIVKDNTLLAGVGEN